MAKFEIKKTSDYEHRFILKASNGKTILTSETYNSLDGVLKSIETVKKQSGQNARYEKKQSRDGKFYFVLNAANGKIIGTSQQYRTKSGMYKGIKAVKNSAGAAQIVDMTKSKPKLHT